MNHKSPKYINPILTSSTKNYNATTNLLMLYRILCLRKRSQEISAIKKAKTNTAIVNQTTIKWPMILRISGWCLFSFLTVLTSPMDLSSKNSSGLNLKKCAPRLILMMNTILTLILRRSKKSNLKSKNYMFLINLSIRLPCPVKSSKSTSLKMWKQCNKCSKSHLTFFAVKWLMSCTAFWENYATSQSSQGAKDNTRRTH